MFRENGSPARDDALTEDTWIPLGRTPDENDQQCNHKQEWLTLKGTIETLLHS